MAAPLAPWPQGPQAPQAPLSPWPPAPQGPATLLGPRRGGQLLQEMAAGYRPPGRKGPRGAYSGAQAGPPSPPPDPVLWFPGGGAECGVAEGRKDFCFPRFL